MSRRSRARQAATDLLTRDEARRGIGSGREKHASQSGGARYDAQFAKSMEGLMRADLVSLGFVITLLSASLAHGQLIIDVSKDL